MQWGAYMGSIYIATILINSSFSIWNSVFIGPSFHFNVKDAIAINGTHIQTHIQRREIGSNSEESTYIQTNKHICHPHRKLQKTSLTDLGVFFKIMKLKSLKGLNQHRNMGTVASQSGNILHKH